MDLLDGGLERLAKLCRKYSRLRRRRSGSLGKRFRSGKLFRRRDRFIPFNPRRTSPGAANGRGDRPERGVTDCQKTSSVPRQRHPES
jgi:hypothetical protein